MPIDKVGMIRAIEQMRRDQPRNSVAEYLCAGAYEMLTTWAPIAATTNSADVQPLDNGVKLTAPISLTESTLPPVSLTRDGKPRKRAPKGTFDRKAYNRDYARARKRKTA